MQLTMPARISNATATFPAVTPSSVILSPNSPPEHEARRLLTETTYFYCPFSHPLTYLLGNNEIARHGTVFVELTT